ERAGPRHPRGAGDRAAAGAGGHPHGLRRAARQGASRLGGRPPGRGGGRCAQVAGRGVRRAGPRLRPARGGGRLALLLPPGVRRRGRGLRAGGPAGPAHPGRAGDAVGRRLQAADLAGPGLRDPRCQRRRRHADPAQQGTRRGGRPGRGERRQPLPHHGLLPRAHRHL
ncbi:MAG: Segregation and condensation protein B, partial [uncultured Nocardioides sp.]